MVNEHVESVEGQEEWLEPGTALAGESTAPEPESAEEALRIDLNTATVEELCQLPGIGPALAARIVNYRLEVHPFEEPVEIAAVPGISETMYTRIAGRLTVGPGVEPGVEEPPLPEPEPEGVAAEEVPAPEPLVEEVPPPRPMPPPVWPAPPPARDSGWARLLTVGLVSAFAGAILALLVLLLVNGTLNFRGATTRALQIEAFRLDGEIQALDADLSQLQGRLEAMQDLAAQVTEVQTGLGRLGGALAEARGELDSIAGTLRALRQESTNLRQDLDGLAGTVGAHEMQLSETREQIINLSREVEAARSAAERFDAFLAGLRELLYETQGPALRGTPATPLPPTRTPWVTPTP